jgi:glycerate-2-kinase
MKIQNFAEWAITDLRKAALEIAEAGLEAIDTEKAVKNGVVLNGEILKVRNKKFNLSGFERIFVVGVGKCALEAGRALEEIMGGKLSGGIVLDVHKGSLNKIRALTGSHPYPTMENVNATTEIIQLLSSLTEKDFIIFVVSGGGSTLLCQPKDLVCQDERDILGYLFKAGADIEEINTVRKHLSLARGGHLAAYANPAKSVALIFSDIPGGKPEFVASGPTIKDSTTVDDARRILDKYGIEKQTGLKINPLKTPKEDKYFENVTNLLFLDDSVALEAMAGKADSLGFHSEIAAKAINGEAREVGSEIAAQLRKTRKNSVLIYGGETTVTVKGTGKGGRNQELVLGALNEVGPDELILSLASDGRDDTDFAGAICDTITSEKAAKLGLNPAEFLKNNDSYSFFQKVGGYISTGDTGSNVSDLIIAVKK